MTGFTNSNHNFDNIVRGYHGTNLKAAESILNHGFNPSANAYDWLGKGVYFWQDAPNRAWNWARKNHPDDSPVVLCSELNLKDCMDLLDSNPDNDWYYLLKNTYISLKKMISQMTEEELRQLQPPIQKGKLHGWDRLCINFLIEQILEPQNIQINSVRAAFREGEPLFVNSGLYDLAHVQIAIRNLTAINKTWIYRK